MRRLARGIALAALLAFGSVSAQTGSPPAPATAAVSSDRQDKINQIVNNNPLATEDGKRVWANVFQATTRLAITKAGQKAGLGSEWEPKHPLWQEIEQSTLGSFNELATSMVQQTQKKLPAALAGFTDEELDAVQRANRSPLIRKAEAGLSQAIQLMSLISRADLNDPKISALIKAETESQQQLLKEITGDPEMAAYIKSTAAQKMAAVSMQLFSQMPQVSARMEVTDVDMHLRIALYQAKPAADIVPLRNAMMFATANAGNLDELKKQLALGADAHARDTRQGKNKGTLLHYAVNQPDTGMLDYLLAHGLRDLVDTLSGSGQSPLHATAASNRLAHAARLLDAGANIHLTTNGRGAAIHAAATKGHLAMTKFLVSRGADVNATDATTGTPLHQAVFFGDPDLVEWLITHKADVNAIQPAYGNTPLHHLGIPRDSTNFLKLMTLLLNAGANPLLENKSGLAAYTQVAGRNEEAALLLLDRIPVDKRNTLPEPPLITAMRVTHLKVIERLLNEGADPNATDKTGRTALFILPFRNQPTPEQVAATKLLLNRGADPLRRDTSGQSLLDVAAATGGPAFGVKADALVGIGLRANTPGPDGRTPLHRAPDKGTVEKLIALGAEVNAQDKNGNTPVHEAVRRNNRAAVQALVTAGANLSTRNAADESPATLAQNIKLPAQRDEMLKLLAPRPGI